MKILIAGAGVAGLSVAHALVKAGVRPTVVARDGGATACGAGIVSAQFWDPRLAAHARRSQQIIESLLPVVRCGMAQIALSEEKSELLSRIEGVERRLPEELQRALAHDFLPRVVAATFSPGDFYVGNERLLAALAEGSQLLRQEIEEIGPGWLKTGARVLEADWLVVATGAYGPGGVRRCLTQLAAHPARLPCMFHILDSGIYARPHERGALAGDGDADWDGKVAPAVTPAFLEHMESQLSGILRGGGRLQAVSAGPIACTADGRPLVETAGKNVLLSGFGGDGLALAPAYGEEVARLLLED